MSGVAPCAICEVHWRTTPLVRLAGAAAWLCQDCMSHDALVKAWTEGYERRSGHAVDLPDRVLP